METTNKNLPVISSKYSGALQAWLVKNYKTSGGIRVRIYKKNSGITSVTFGEALDEGLCFGWSASLRHKGDADSYLQRFTPGKTMVTASKRNMNHIKRLIEENKMMPAGLTAIGV
jgi:uncharacterized protein YdeI (YjbR/CyaY-like superfamily)